MTPIGHRLRWRTLPMAARRARQHVAFLLPKPDAGWRHAVGTLHREQFEAAAQAHGLSLEGYTDEALTQLRQWAVTSHVRVRMDAADVASFLHDRKYRNQFVTGTSQGAYADAG